MTHDHRTMIDHHREDLEFEQRDGRLGWWEALFLGLAIGVLLGALLAGWSK